MLTGSPDAAVQPVQSRESEWENYKSNDDSKRVGTAGKGAHGHQAPEGHGQSIAATCPVPTRGRRKVRGRAGMRGRPEPIGAFPAPRRTAAREHRDDATRGTEYLLFVVEHRSGSYHAYAL